MSAVINDNKNQDKNEWLRRGMMMFAESTGLIAFPVVGALFLGRWLDEKQGTEPLYFLSITILAFIISSIGIGMTGVKYMKRIEKEDSLRPKPVKNLKGKDENESGNK